MMVLFLAPFQSRAKELQDSDVEREAEIQEEVIEEQIDKTDTERLIEIIQNNKQKEQL